MSAGSSRDQGLSHDAAAGLRTRVAQLRAFIGSLNDVARTGDAVSFCEEALVAWQGQAMSDAPMPGTLAMLVVVEVLQRIAEQRVRLLLDEAASRDRTQASLTESLTASCQEYERWLTDGMPTEAEVNRRTAERKVTYEKLKTEVEDKRRASETGGDDAASSPKPKVSSSRAAATGDRIANLSSDEQMLLKCVEMGVPFFGSSATVRGSVIREIALRDLVERLNPNGVNIANAHIKDAIILGNVSSDVALHFKSCSFDKTIHVSGARLPLLRFENCQFRPQWGAAVAAEGLKLAGSFSVHDCVIEVRKANAAIELDNASIGSHLSLQRTTIINPDGQCISGDRAKIGSNLTLSGVHAKSGHSELGAVRFSIAEIGGRINLTEGTRIDALGGPAVMLDGIKVGEDVHAVEVVAEAARAKEGTFRVSGAEIGGAFTIAASQIKNDSSAAVVADRLRVRGSVMIGPQTAICGAGSGGALRLMGARVEGSVSFDNAAVIDPTGPAIAAETMVVEGHLHLNGGLKVVGAGDDGVIRLGGARVGRRLQANEAGTAEPTGGLVLDLGDATVGRLQLSPHFVAGDSRWLSVDRLSYTGLPMGATRGEWIDILRYKTADYSPQAWRHLADAFRDAGHDNDARRVLFAQQRDRADRTLRPANRDGENRFRLWLQRRWLMVLRVTIGYGYQVGRALAWLAAIAVLSVALGLAAGNIEYRGQRLAMTADAAATQGGPCSSIEQVGMGLGIGLPLIKQAVSDSCRIDSSSSLGQVLTVAGWLLQASSWVFATLFIAGFTKVIRMN
jgi:hypothetical protein